MPDFQRDPDAFFQQVQRDYADHLNPYLGKLMAFAGFGVEVFAERSVIRDHEGREFIDCLGGYGCFTFGHRHPRVIEAVRDQLESLALSGKAFFNATTAEMARKLTEIAPQGLDYAFFCNSGAEAVEGALKFAKGVTGRQRILSTHGSYHGKTLGALSTTGREKYRKRFEPLLPGVEFVEFGDTDAATARLDGSFAAVIVEPIQGEGGIIIPPDGYLRRLRELCDHHNVLLIFDEVQTGLGRTGQLFACDYEGVSPDLMTLAKALGGGVMPLGAVLGTRAVFESVYEPNPLAHTSTFGGNPLACAAGIAALDVLLEEDIPGQSRDKGHRMLQGFLGLKHEFPELVADVRGRGLMIGLEFAMDEVGELVVAQLLKRGICVAYALNNPRVLRFEPPAVITYEQIDAVVTGLRDAVQETNDLLAMLV